MVVLCIFSSSNSEAATFTVDSLFQAPDNVPGDGICATFGGECSLQAAIDEAEALAGSDTIVLVSGATYTLAGACAGTCTAENALPDVTTTVVITGNGATLSLAGGSTRFFKVSGNLTLNSLSMTGATASYPGSAVYVDAGGTVTINSNAIYNNTGCPGATDYGGAIHSQGTLTINSSSIASNNCTNGAYGGAIYGSNTSTITISKSAVFGNVASGGGSKGGGVAAFGDLDIVNSTISTNSSQGDGGGIYFNNVAGNATIIYSTIYGNTSAGNGGGFVLTGGGVGSLSISSSIVSTNTVASTGPDCLAAAIAPITSDGFNFFSSASGCNGIVGGDQIGGTPPYDDGIVASLGAISSTNGVVYYVSDYSATITEAGNPATCTATDMLGQTRGSPCDVGAVEQAWCGDSILQITKNYLGVTEQCDDGNTNNGDGCSNTCQTEVGGGGDGRFIATINTDDCQTSHVSDSDLSLGEAILLLNGTLTFNTMTAGEQSLLEETTGTNQIICEGSGCSPVIDCDLPTVNNTEAFIFGSSTTPFTITSQDLGSAGVSLEIAGDSVTLQSLTMVGDNDSTALYVTGNSFTLKGATITGYDVGLALDTVTTATIGTTSQPNYFMGNGLGVMAQTSTSLTFTNNVFGLTDGILVDTNDYGLALIDVTNSTFTSNTIGASTEIGLLVSGATNLTFNSNNIGTNVNGSRPLGLNWQTGIGADFEILTTALAGFPLPAMTEISGINLGDTSNSSLNNYFCYNENNMIISGSEVEVIIGLNDFCSSGSGSSGLYSIREGANAGGLETSLGAPEITEVSATLVSGTNYSVQITGEAQAGTDVRVYKQEVSSSGEVSSTVYVCDLNTDALGNFDDACSSEMYETTTNVYFLAQACSQNCAVVSEFSPVSSQSTLSLSEESATSGVGYQNASTGGGCQLSQSNLNATRKISWMLPLFLTILSLPYLKKRQGR